VRWTCEYTADLYSAASLESLQRFALLAEHAYDCREWLAARDHMAGLQRDFFSASKQLASDFLSEQERAMAMYAHL
jgi:hypothetical protein